MSDLKLDSLRIQNFRTFKDLTIDRLGRVNLIVGKNNVGKTSLLEALNLYVSGGRGTAKKDLIRTRQLDILDEYRSTTRSRFGVELPPERHLFYGRPDLESVGPDDDELPAVPPIRITSDPKRNQTFEVYLQRRDRSYVEAKIKVEGEDGISSRVLGEKTISVFVSSRDIRAEAGRYWDQISLTPHEERVVEALRVIDPDIEGIRYSVADVGNGRRGKGFPIARLKGQDRPDPLSNLGEGMNRSFAIIVAMVRAEGGILLIDEFENGLHYSVQPDMWRMIFETAQDLDVQVFATTHSHDCVKAFDRVARDYEDEEGMLIQLRRRRSDPEEIVAVTADEDELESALHTGVDPR